MRYVLSSIAVLLLVALISGVAFAQDAQKEWYDDVGIYLDHDVEHHFFEAKAHFEAGDFHAAAENIRGSATLLKIDAVRLSSSKYEELEDASKELNNLADRVDNGEVKSMQEIRDVFAHTHYVLATRHLANAREKWLKKDTENTGHAISASVRHIKNAMEWADVEADKVFTDLLDDIVPVTEKLMKDTGWVSEEVEKILDAVGKELEKLGKSLESKKQQ